MKKLFFCLSALMLLSAPMFAESTEGDGVFPVEKEGQSNENATLEQSHWSIYVPFGMTFADMDETKGAKLGSGLTDLTLNGGIGVEYNFTPTWGVAAEFGVAHYGMNSFSFFKSLNESGSQDSKNYQNSLGMLYNMGVFFTFDFMDAFFPKRTNTLFNLYAQLGGGVGFYTFRNGSDSIVLNNISNKEKKYSYDPFLGFGLLADFNLSRNWSLGLRAHYNYYMSDNLDFTHSAGQMGNTNGRANSNNDGIFTVDAVVHYKFTSQEKSHVRNMAIGTLASLEKKAEKEADARNAAAYTPQRDTLVISHIDTLMMLGQNGANGYRERNSNSLISEDYLDLYFVYFDNDKYKLNDQGHIEVQQMAARLQANPNACLELSGHTDATASDDYNDRLAARRAAAVLDELVNLYGIDPSRLVDLGRGKLTNVNASFGPNRRVDMRIVSREMVDSIRAEKEKGNIKPMAKADYSGALSGATTTTTSTVSEAEALSNVKAETYDTDKYLAVEKTGVSTTLSKLARKYYNNTNCWVYIYLANKDVIKSPSYLWPNTKLYIPKLTEEEKAITKEAASALVGE